MDGGERFRGGGLLLAFSFVSGKEKEERVSRFNECRFNGGREMGVRSFGSEAQR